MIKSLKNLAKEETLKTESLFVLVFRIKDAYYKYDEKKVNYMFNSTFCH